MNSIEVDLSKTKVVYNQKELKTIKGIQSFLGFYNFYQQFIAQYGRVAKLLNCLTHYNVPFVQDKACQEAFDSLKESITLAPILYYYKPEWETIVKTDVSNRVVVGVLSQRNLEILLQHPITFFSKTIMSIELNYSIPNKEILVVVQSLEEWHAYLEGLQSNKSFLLYLDHCSLECFITTKKLSACQAH